MDVDAHDDGQSSETYYPVMLELTSLQDLITTPSRQRSDVRTIIISTDHLSRSDVEDDDITDTYKYGDGGSNGNRDTKYFNANREDVTTINRVDQGAYWSYLLDQEKFTSGLDLAYLIEAMKQLPNCKRICISDAYTPWGAAELEGRIGTRLCKGFDRYSRYSKHFVMHVLRTTFLAISGSNIKVTELDISLGLTNQQDQHAITDDVLHLPDKYRLLWRHGFTNIKTLRLVVSTQDEDEWDENVSSFIRLFPNLSRLRLHLADRGSSVEFSYLTEALHTLSLEVFELVNCSTTQENLMRLLLCHQETAKKQTTIKEIVLEDVNIEHGKNGTWNWVRNHLQTKLPICSLVLRDCLVEGNFPTPRMASWH